MIKISLDEAVHLLDRLEQEDRYIDHRIDISKLLTRIKFATKLYKLIGANPVIYIMDEEMLYINDII